MGGDHSGGDCPELADCPWGIGTLAEALQEVGGGSVPWLSNWTTGNRQMPLSLRSGPVSLGLPLGHRFQACCV